MSRKERANKTIERARRALRTGGTVFSIGPLPQGNTQVKKIKSGATDSTVTITDKDGMTYQVNVESISIVE
jgi:hypothetical protein